MTKYMHETRRVCLECHREVDAVRTTDASGLHISRHLARGRDGFCSSSLTAAERKE
jgi:hypothetical protein